MFFNQWQQIDFNNIAKRLEGVTRDEVRRTLNSSRIDDMLPLFSPAAAEFLEEMAVRAAATTKERFGNTIQLYAPLYLSNECGNSCLYCGFSGKNRDITRRTLSTDEIEREVEAIYNMGIQHLLLVCGEAPAKVPISYLKEAIHIAAKRMAYIAIEIYPTDVDSYRELVEAGVDGLTVYQETYNATRYAELHPAGRKRDMPWRLDTPDRGALAGVRTLGVGALLGLDNPYADAYMAAYHARYLMKTYWRSQVTISFPRMRYAEGCVVTPVEVTDRTFVQFITAARIAMPDVGIVVSTRERASLRDNLAGLGVTQMSAASVTEPGGYTDRDISTAQFQVEDSRSVEEFAAMLTQKGFEPVVKDWDHDLH
ncbi:MAG: 2-iminoacetate synthase ThiH [Deferribacteraceae bacterium]|nr:2-iminoacetate synthase ThiH [Deferribacteraceae bacterium]